MILQKEYHFLNCLIHGSALCVVRQNLSSVPKKRPQALSLRPAPIQRKQHLPAQLLRTAQRKCIGLPPENFPLCVRILPGDARNSTKMKKPVCFARLPLTSRRLHRTSPMGISLIFSLCLRMI